MEKISEWKEVESSSGSRSNSRKFMRKRRDISADFENEATCSDEMKFDQKLTKHRILDESKQRFAKPLIRCVWTGNLDVWHGLSKFSDRNYSFNAFLSSKACDKVRHMAGALQSGLQLEMLHRSYLWPKSFPRSGPTDDAIGLFFFPPAPEHEKPYDSLVNEMIRDDLAMTAYLKDPELPIYSDLLIFTSVELQWQCRRYQGKFYLWGVFRRCED